MQLESLEDLDTPSLIVDLSIMEKNMLRMASFAKECGVNLRPHAKTHKVPEIANMQLQAGANGICLQKLSEGEVFADHGINDIFITNQIVGAKKVERLALLAEKVHLGVAVDDSSNVTEISNACARIGSELDLYVEVDVGMHRCGVEPKQAMMLAQQILKQKNVVFKGIMAYEGQVSDGKTKEERLKLCKEAMNLVAKTKNLMKEQHIPVDVVSVGSSVSTWTNARDPGVTEVQPGMYLFNDIGLVEREVATLDDCALSVLATVMSKPSNERAVTDAGSKAFNFDQRRFPESKRDGVKLAKFSEEHGWITLEGMERNKISLGDKIEFIPYHCCTCLNQHNELIGLRNSRVEKNWQIAARGKMT